MHHNTCARLGLLTLTMSLMVVAACNKAPQFPNCKTDAHCAAGNAGEANKNVCVFGSCQECGNDLDCESDQRCQDSKCMSMCASNIGCQDDQQCVDGYCVETCENSFACSDNETCLKGRCVVSAKHMSCSDSSDCVGGFSCESGLCVQEETTNSFAENDDCERSIRVFFDFDRDAVKNDFKDKMGSMSKCLRDNPSWNINVEGHTDSRGSLEYNIVLGERRARSVSNLLTKLGVARERMKVVSYGEERPLVLGENEEAWSQNRRGEIYVN